MVPFGNNDLSRRNTVPRTATRSLLATFVLAITLAASFVVPVDAAAGAQAQTVHACSVLDKAEVKKLAPWPDFLDQMQPEEEPLATGSACNYPSVYLQVMSTDETHWKGLVAALKNPTMESIAGVGDEAYLRNN